MKKYKENSGQRDMMYESRKRDMIDRLGEENDIWQERNAAEAVAERDAEKALASSGL